MRPHLMYLFIIPYDDPVVDPGQKYATLASVLSSAVPQ